MENIQLSKFDKFIKIYKIILISLYLLVTLFLIGVLIYYYFDDVNRYKNGETFILGLAAAFIVFVLIIGGLSYSVFEILSLIGLCCVVKSVTISNKPKNKRFFIWAIIINIITFLSLIGFSYILIRMFENIKG